MPDKHITSRDPTPSAVAIFREEWENLVDRQPAEVGRVVQLRYEGATYREIANELQINERTARKAIDKLETRPPTGKWRRRRGNPQDRRSRHSGRGLRRRKTRSR